MVIDNKSGWLGLQTGFFLQQHMRGSNLCSRGVLTNNILERRGHIVDVGGVDATHVDAARVQQVDAVAFKRLALLHYMRALVLAIETCMNELFLHFMLSRITESRHKNEDKY